MFDPQTVKVVAQAVAARLCVPGQRPNYVQNDMAGDITAAALTALCAHLPLPPEALADLASGKACVVPVEATEDMLCAARDWALAKYGQGIGNDGAQGCLSVMLAASPYAQGGSDA